MIPPGGLLLKVGAYFGRFVDILLPMESVRGAESGVEL